MEELGRYRDLLEGDTEELLQTFARAQIDRESFISEPHPRRLEGEEPADIRKELINSLVGGWVAERVKKARALPGLARGTRTSRAERLAEDIRRDLDKLEEKRRKKDRG